MEKRQYRVLQVLTAMNRGGAETMVMNHYRALDRNNVQFDFLVHRTEKGDYDDEIEKMGGRIFRAFPIRPWTYLKYFRWLDRFFREHGSEFIAVHGHIQENSGFALKYAKKYGINTLVASSHIADLGIDYKYFFRKFGKKWTNKYATTRIACGNAAGKFLYGRRDFFLLNNAIDTARYKFSPEVRYNKRDEFGIPQNVLVIGSVARFSPQKNHVFIIKVFAEILKTEPKAILILVGTGPLMAQTQKIVRDYGIESNVIFAGLRSDVPDILQTFDVFLMPSLFEGLPVSVIEAQAAGLPCVISDTIDMETNITGKVHFLSLKTSVSIWAKTIINSSTDNRICDMSSLNHYDVHENIHRLMYYYIHYKNE